MDREPLIQSPWIRSVPAEERHGTANGPRRRAAAKKFGWGNQKPAAGRGFGLAVGTDKGSVVAWCAEVAVDSDKVQVVRVTTAFECGAILNPDHLTNQIEGAVIMGLGGALSEQIDFENGRIVNPAFSAYKVPRFRDAPVFETVLLDRKDQASGEPAPIIAVAPAVGAQSSRRPASAAVDADGTRGEGGLARRGRRPLPCASG